VAPRLVVTEPFRFRSPAALELKQTLLSEGEKQESRRFSVGGQGRLLTL
jgi:hypothetical protein